MNGGGAVIFLSLFTLIAGLAVVGSSFLYFLRRRRNRQIAGGALIGRDGHPGDAPDGALPDLLALFVVALIAMGLLGLGYASS